jgi:hypothetical protein
MTEDLNTINALKLKQNVMNSRRLKTDQYHTILQQLYSKVSTSDQLGENDATRGMSLTSVEYQVLNRAKFGLNNYNDKCNLSKK